MNRRKVGRVIGLVIVLAAVVVAGVAKHEVVTRSLHSIHNVELRWIPVAIFASIASIFAAARIHRRLLNSTGENLSVRPLVAITFAGNAISVSIPLAGTELSTAFTYDQFRYRGIDAAKAVWALTTSGAASMLSFALLAVFGALVSANKAADISGLVGLVITITVLIILVGAVRNDRVRRRLVEVLIWLLRGVKRVIHRPRRDPVMLVQRFVTQLISLKIRRRQWFAVLGAAMWNWVADLFCFIICIHAVGAPVPWAGVTLAFVAGAGTNSLGLVPGGIGLVEVALTAALVNAGVPSPQALSAVLIYRIITFWMVTAIGWIIFTILRRRSTDVPFGAEAEG